MAMRWAMDDYNPATVFSAIDQMGRYAYANQPQIGQWNLTMFAKTLLPCIHPNPEEALGLAKGVIATFPTLYKSKWLNMMRAKLGLFGTHSEDEGLISELLNHMHNHNMDYTNTFYDLSTEAIPNHAIYQSPTFKHWHQRWQDRLHKNKQPRNEASALMQQTNPIIIPRNHTVERVLPCRL